MAEQEERDRHKILLQRKRSGEGMKRDRVRHEKDNGMRNLLLPRERNELKWIHTHTDPLHSHISHDTLHPTSAALSMASAIQGSGQREFIASCKSNKRGKQQPAAGNLFLSSYSVVASYPRERRRTDNAELIFFNVSVQEHGRFYRPSSNGNERGIKH